MRRNTRCNLIEWKPINTGNCHVKYTIQYKNQTSVIGIIAGIHDTTHALCSSLYSDATAITMWAVYNGHIGTKSSTIPLMDSSENCSISHG